MVFKIISTIAVGLFVTVWAFRNLRSINDWLVEYTGIGMTAEERKAKRLARQEASEVTAEDAVSEPVVVEKPTEEN